MKSDLTDGKNRPKWILSTYGPGKNPPASLFEGNEYSFEELRVRYYELAANGKQAQADQEAGGLWSKADSQMKDVINNADNVVKFMEEAEKKHPNRHDFCKADGTKKREEVAKEAELNASAGGAPGFGTGAFGQTATANKAFGTPTPTFGQPAAPTGFGAGGFGQPSKPTSFGQPSNPSPNLQPLVQVSLRLAI